MAVSGSIDFNLVANDIIDEAYELCGIRSEAESVTPFQYASAKRSLNLLIKSWGTSDHLWLRTAGTKALAGSTASYALTPKPGRILEVRRRTTSGSVDFTMTEWSRSGYMDISTKTTEGSPTHWFYDPQSAAGTLYVWPTPSAAVAAASTLEYTYLRRMDDFDSSNDDADIPQEWLEALSFGLAERLALKFGVRSDLRAEIAARAKMLKEHLESWDTEPSSIYIQPESRTG